MGGIINKQKLHRLRDVVGALRGSIHNIKPDDLISLAKALGREKTKKGKHPTYASTLLSRNPLSIPAHRKVSPGAAGEILDELEADIDALSDLLDQQERINEAKRLPSPTVHKGGNSR